MNDDFYNYWKTYFVQSGEWGSMEIVVKVDAIIYNSMPDKLKTKHPLEYWYKVKKIAK